MLGVNISCRRDLDGDLHCEMVRRGSDPRALQGNRRVWIMHDRDAHQVLIPDHAARRIEVDPAEAGDIDLDPGMGMASGDTVVVLVAEMQISGHKARGEPQ